MSTLVRNSTIVVKLNLETFNLLERLNEDLSQDAAVVLRSGISLYNVAFTAIKNGKSIGIVKGDSVIDLDIVNEFMDVSLTSQKDLTVGNKQISLDINAKAENLLNTLSDESNRSIDGIISIGIHLYSIALSAELQGRNIGIIENNLVIQRVTLKTPEDQKL